MGIGNNVHIGGDIIEQGERLIDDADVSIALTQFSTPCKRVWVRAPTSDDPVGAANTSSVMIGCGACRIVLAANPSDGDYIHIVNRGVDTFFEFDSNGSVTSGRIGVTIAAGLSDTIQNLLNTINYTLCLNGGHSLSAPPVGWGSAYDRRVFNRLIASYTEDLDSFGTYIEVRGGITDITKSGSNITVYGPNYGGTMLLANDDSAGFDILVQDAADIVLTGLTDGDAVEYQVFA